MLHRHTSGRTRTESGAILNFMAAKRWFQSGLAMRCSDGAKALDSGPGDVVWIHCNPQAGAKRKTFTRYWYSRRKRSTKEPGS
jgi:hypothetical protein